MAIVNYTYWRGDGETSGLLGLGYPYLTSLHGPTQNQPPYDPVFTTMWKSGVIDPLFSIALSRNESKGRGPAQESYLALGGLPPVEVDETTWARTPIQAMSAITEWNLDTEELGMYIVTPEAFVLEKPGAEVLRATKKIPVLVDVGATLSVLPRGESRSLSVSMLRLMVTDVIIDLVDQLYAAFDPPAQYVRTTGLYFAPCNATAPRFGLEIGGQAFYFAPQDLLRQTVRDPTGTLCRIGVTDAYSPPFVLGVTFLSNVLAVFDVGKTEMRFVMRKEY